MFSMPIFSWENSLEQVLLQSEEDLLSKRSSDIVSEGVAPKSKKIIGKMKVQGIVMFLFLLVLIFSSVLFIILVSLYIKTSITSLKY